MDNAVLVNVGEGIGDFAQHAHRLANRELPVALQSGPQRFAFDERHHILPLYDSGEVEGALYYVMPLVDGETLRARLDRDRVAHCSLASRSPA